MNQTVALAGAVAGILLGSGPATWAQTPDKSQYHLFRPTPKHEMREFWTDRPDRTESPYSVDAGHFQLETDLVSYVYEKSGAETHKILSFNFMNVKVGLTNRIDFQAIFETLRISRVQGPGEDTRKSSAGERILRLKVNLLGNDEGNFALAAMPAFNFDLGPSFLIPALFHLPYEFALGAMLQWNRVLYPDEGPAYNDWIASLALSRDIIGGLGAYIELFGVYGDSPLVRWRPTFDAGLTWLVVSDFQLDAGVNIGISDPGSLWNPFLGLSFRL